MDKNGKVTVAFFLPSLEPGGTERGVVNLVNTIDRGRYSVSLVLGNMEGDFISQVRKDIPMINLDARHSLPLFFKLLRYFKQQQPDIFISAFPRINIICLAARMFSGVKTKLIVTEHSVFSMLPMIAKTFWRRLFARLFMPFLGRLMYPAADAIVCVSKGVARDISSFITAPGAVTVIYNPVIDDRIYQLAQEPVLHPWFSDASIPVILAVGRLVDCKDYPTLFSAFRLVALQQSVRLVILGRGPEEEKLTSLVTGMGLSASVAFLGFQENPFKYMAKASVFVLSSLQEGFGNVIIEAMACGIPVVSTDCPTGPGEIIDNGKNGMLVPVRDEKSMATAILDILHDHNMVETFKVEGKKRAEIFSVKKSVAEYEALFAKLIL